MALGVGAYFGEGAYLKKHGIPKPEWKIYQQKCFLMIYIPNKTF